MSEIEIVNKKVKNNKALGFNDTSYEFYNFLPDLVRLNLLSVYNKVYKEEKVPEIFKKSIVFLSAQKR